MSTPLPPSLRVIRDGMDSVRYVLPCRALGKVRWVGLVIVGFGLAVTAFMVFWMYGPIRGGMQSDDGFRWGQIVFGLMGLPGLAAGLGLLAVGLGVVSDATHTEVALTRDRLTVDEKLGPLRWRFRRQFSEIRRFVLQKGLEVQRRNRAALPPFMPDFAILIAECHNGKPLWIAPGYRADALRPLARVLAEAAGAAQAEVEGVGADGIPALAVVECAAGESTVKGPVPRPADTDIVCQESPGAIAISVPPAGLRKGTHGLFMFGILWNAFIVICLVVMIVTMVRSKGDGFPAVSFLIMLPFLLIGGGMLAGAIHMGRRRALLALANGSLAYRSISPFGTKEQRVHGSEIEAIRVGPSGMEINDVPVMQLQVHLRGGRKKIGMLSQRREEELEWLADVLRRALDVGG